MFILGRNMQNLDENNSIVTKIIDDEDHDIFDWGSFFDDDINFDNDKLINSLKENAFYFQNMNNLDEDISTFSRNETSCEEPVKALLSHGISSSDYNKLTLNNSVFNDEAKSCPQSFFKGKNAELTVETAYKLPSSGNFSNTNSHLLNPVIKNTCFIPEKRSLYQVTEKSNNSQDNIRYKCTARDQTIVIQEYPSKEYIYPASGILNEVGLNYSEYPKIFNTQNFTVSTKESSKMIISNHVSLRSQKNTICNEADSTYGKTTSSEENFDNQSMIISSQGSSDSQRMIISSQGSSDSQRMIISSQGSSDSQPMIISSQDSFSCQEMVNSSEESLDSQKMIASSQEKLDNQNMTTSSQESRDSQKMFISSQDRNIKNISISSQETPINRKMFNSRPESFLRITKKINFKKEGKSYHCLTSPLTVNEKKLHKFLNFKRIEKSMKIENVSTAIEYYRSAKFNKQYGDTVANKRIQKRELKVTKREYAVKKREKLATAREADIQKYENTIKTRKTRIS